LLDCLEAVTTALGKLSQDELMNSGEQTLKCKVFVPVSDTVLVQLKETFTDPYMDLTRQMQIIVPSALIDDDIHKLCTNYSTNVVATVTLFNGSLDILFF